MAINNRLAVRRPIALSAIRQQALPLDLRPAGSTRTYVVSPGDTTLKLAHRFRTTPAVLAALNPSRALVINKQPAISLRTGDTITVPARGAAAARFAQVLSSNVPTDADCGSGFVASRFSDSPSPGRGLAFYNGCLAANNGQACDVAGRGGVINAFGVCFQPCGPGTVFDATSGSCKDLPGTVPTALYVVNAGDSVAKIARKLGVTTTAVVALNPRLGIVQRSTGLDLRSLIAGAPIRVPGKAIRGGALAGPSTYEDANGDNQCPAGWDLDVGLIYDSCLFGQRGQPCGNGGTYDDDGNCKGESSGGGGDDGGGSDPSDSALTTALGMPGGGNAYSAYQAGVDPATYANSLSVGGRYAICTIAAIVGLLLSGGFAVFIAGVCASATASKGADNGGGSGSGNDEYPKPCGAAGSGFYEFEPGAPCAFAGAGADCDGQFGVGKYDANGECIVVTGGAQCGTPNGFAGHTNSSQQCIVDQCPADKKANQDETDCIALSAPPATPPGTNPGTGGVKPGPANPPKGGGGAAPPPKDKPPSVKPQANAKSGGKKESSNTLLYVGAGVAAAAAVGLALYQKKGKKK